MRRRQVTIAPPIRELTYDWLSIADTIGFDEGAAVIPFLSVVVPVGRINKATYCCLQALANQTLPREYFEVILVLDGLAPIPDLFSECRVYTLGKRCGRSAARNCGLIHARGILIASRSLRNRSSSEPDVNLGLWAVRAIHLVK